MEGMSVSVMLRHKSQFYRLLADSRSVLRSPLHKPMITTLSIAMI